ncbi:MAG: L,D-transpeptidase family protein, partial [Pseudomonadales bacterium]
RLALRAFYEKRDFEPLWVNVNNLSDIGESWFDILQTVADDGLEQTDYRLALINKLIQAAGNNAQADLELTLSDAYLKYCEQLSTGRLKPYFADSEWHIRGPIFDASTVLDTLSEGSRLKKIFKSLRPASEQYLQLKEVLRRYRKIEAQGGWPQIPEAPAIKSGVRHQVAIVLRNRLRISNDFKGEMQADPYYFDAVLDDALRRFQRRHGLRANGVLSDKTRDALNIGVDKRIAQIKIALERWRWLPTDLGERFVWVSPVGAVVTVMKQGNEVLAMRAIVGRPYRATPSFSATVNKVVINPTWTVPRSIAVADLLPVQQEDTGFFQRKHIRVFSNGKNAKEIDPATINWSALGKDNFPYKLRQDAGPSNSLGRIKFAFPNAYDIYLHDTPGKFLFNLPNRTFSSGCVRIEKPLELASALATSEWTTDEIQQDIDAGKTRGVNLLTPTPIYLVYMTTRVNADGDVYFHDDVYARDAAVSKAWGASL